jgi:hypothetical protein
MKEPYRRHLAGNPTPSPAIIAVPINGRRLKNYYILGWDLLLVIRHYGFGMPLEY